MPALGEVVVRLLVQPPGGLEAAEVEVRIPVGQASGEGGTELVVNPVPAVAIVPGDSRADAAAQLAARASTERGAGTWQLEVAASSPVPVGSLAWQATLEPTRYLADVR